MRRSNLLLIQWAAALSAAVAACATAGCGSDDTGVGEGDSGVVDGTTEVPDALGADVTGVDSPAEPDSPLDDGAAPDSLTPDSSPLADSPVAVDAPIDALGDDAPDSVSDAPAADGMASDGQVDGSADAGDATVPDASDSSTPDASDATSPDAAEAADANDASSHDASDASKPDASDAGAADAACTRGALSFDGTDDFVLVPGTTALGLGTAMTIEAWVKTKLSAASETMLLAKHACTADDGWFLGLGAGSPAVGDYYIGHSRPVRVVGTATLNDGAWHHLAGTADGITATLYVDGVLQGSAAQGALAANALDIQIGAGSGCGFYEGVLDEVSVWSVARTAAQIAQDHAAPVTGSEPGLEGYWNFDESGCGLTAVDRSPNGRTAELGGASSQNAADPTWVADGPF